jgi:hypothetical protein
MPQFGEIFVNVTVTVVVKTITETDFIVCGTVGIVEVRICITVIVYAVRATRLAEYFRFRLL